MSPPTSTTGWHPAASKRRATRSAIATPSTSTNALSVPIRRLRPPHSTAPAGHRRRGGARRGRAGRGTWRSARPRRPRRSARPSRRARPARAGSPVRRRRPAHVARAPPAVGPQRVEAAVVADPVVRVALDVVAADVAELGPGVEEAGVPAATAASASRRAAGSAARASARACSRVGVGGRQHGRRQPGGHRDRTLVGHVPEGRRATSSAMTAATASGWVFGPKWRAPSISTTGSPAVSPPGGRSTGRGGRRRASPWIATAGAVTAAGSHGACVAQVVTARRSSPRPRPAGRARVPRGSRLPPLVADQPAHEPLRRVGRIAAAPSRTAAHRRRRSSSATSRATTAASRTRRRRAPGRGAGRPGPGDVAAVAVAEHDGRAPVEQGDEVGDLPVHPERAADAAPSGRSRGGRSAARGGRRRAGGTA